MSTSVAPASPNSAVVRHADLVSFSRLVGTGYRTVGAEVGGTETVAKGMFQLRQVRPGLLVHASDARHERSVTTHLLKQKSLNFSIVLAGRWQATLGGESLACGGARPEAMFFALAEPDAWSKRAERGDHARMVNVMAAPEWLDDDGLGEIEAGGGAIRALSRRHRAHGQWRPSLRLIAMAEQVLARPYYSGVLQRLYLESRAIEMVAEALMTVAGETPDGAFGVLRPADDRRMRTVRELLDAAPAEALSLAAIAREAGVSVRTLQRQFQSAHGVGLFHYLRERRLDRARDALEREGVTVAQAAHGAGYASAANFTTAFRRRFGLSPKQVRARS